jgi:hypothetical protein
MSSRCFIFSHLPFPLNLYAMSGAPELFQLGGYKLSQSQVADWCQAHDINPPAYETMFVVNRWLASRNIRTRIMSHNFAGNSDYIVITDKRKVIDWEVPMSTFEESENSVDVKTQLGIDEAELQYVTVRKWLRTKSRGRKSFKSLNIPNGASEEDRGRPTIRVVRA